MIETAKSTSPMNYNGTPIRGRSETISLTDMWRAAGSPTKRRPNDWKSNPANQVFIDHVALIANCRVDGIWSGRRGVGGGTFAHWQVAMAYAKYLSPEFHAWANSVIRERMEGAIQSEPEQQEMHLPPPTFDTNVVTKADLKVLCEWIGNRLRSHEERQKANLLGEVKALMSEIWYAKSSLRKDLTDPQRLADRGLLMLPAPTPDTTFITATEICWLVISEVELHKDLPGIIGKRILSHARRHMWPQGETPIRSRRDRPMPTYPVSRVQEWLDSGGADFIREENTRRALSTAERSGAVIVMHQKRQSS